MFVSTCRKAHNRPLLGGLALVGLALASIGCADLTRPDAILIVAEPPPAPPIPEPVADVAPAGDADAPRRPAPRAGGG